MREILFRGRRLDNGEWAHGYYYAEYPYQCIISDEERKKQEKHWIVWQENMDWGLTRMVRAQVDPATVGQYTGLKEKNGREIYEGDMVKYLVYRDYGQAGEHFENQAVIEWNDAHSGFDPFRDCDFYQTEMHTVEVIGNIHDNPELLK